MAGAGRGQLLISQEPLSFWGGYDPATGEIIDRRHPLSGELSAGRVLALPGSRGSSTTTAVMLEAIRAGVAPAALIVRQQDDFFALAAIVADELYQRTIPVVQIGPEPFSQLKSGDWATVSPSGSIEIEEPER